MDVNEAIDHAGQGLMEAEKQASSSYDWILVVREWMTLADCIGKIKPAPWTATGSREE